MLRFLLLLRMIPAVLNVRMFELPMLDETTNPPTPTYKFKTPFQSDVRQFVSVHFRAFSTTSQLQKSIAGTYTSEDQNLTAGRRYEIDG